jgi:putative membrane protein
MKSSSELKSQATAGGIQVPLTLTSANQTELTKLRGLTGADFDKRYAYDLVSGHKSAVSLFRCYAKAATMAA